MIEEYIERGIPLPWILRSTFPDNQVDDPVGSRRLGTEHKVSKIITEMNKKLFTTHIYLFREVTLNRTLLYHNREKHE